MQGPKKNPRSRNNNVEQGERGVVYFNRCCVSVDCACGGDLGHAYTFLYVSAVTNPLQQTGKPPGKGKWDEIHLKRNYGTFAYGKDGITETRFTFPSKTTKKYMQQKCMKDWISSNREQWSQQMGNKSSEPEVSPACCPEWGSRPWCREREPR